LGSSTLSPQPRMSSLGQMVSDLSVRTFNALDAILPNDAFQLVRQAHVVEGWGDIHHVTVFSGIPHHNAGAALEGAIHTIVDDVLDGRRHNVRIVWADTTF